MIANFADPVKGYLVTPSTDRETKYFLTACGQGIADVMKSIGTRLKAVVKGFKAVETYASAGSPLLCEEHLGARRVAVVRRSNTTVNSKKIGGFTVFQSYKHGLVMRTCAMNSV